MEVKEHFFAYNPFDGHPDKITNAPGYNYFFLGNGLIMAAVQYNKSLQGSPIGLLIMDSDKYGKKSDSFTFDEKTGLERTMIDVKYNGKVYSPNSSNLNIYWDQYKKIPTVVARWDASVIELHEEFFCPNFDMPNLIRNVIIKNTSEKKIQGEFYIDMNLAEKTEYKKRKYQFTIDPMNERVFCFIYSIDKNIPGNVYVEETEKILNMKEMDAYWNKINKVNFNDNKFNLLFNAARNQVSAVISADGVMDACIWQYNLQWVRDMSCTAMGCIVAGHFEIAKKIIKRILTEYIDSEGSSLDSGRKRPLDEVELDQNGILLYLLWFYRVWTDDINLITEFWDKVKATANFVLLDVFWDNKTKLLKNCREYWERHKEFGLTTGYELTYQLFAIIGLEKISEIASEIGQNELSKKWKSAAEEIKNSFLTHPKFAMIDDGHFIKRRKENGEVHLQLNLKDKSFLPEGSTLREENNNLLEPDASEVLPIVFGLINPKDPVSFGTLNHIEKLWNQRWHFGGYGRYNLKSEPETPGPWPFSSMFIAKAYLENENKDMVKRVLDWMYYLSPDSGSYFETYSGWKPVPPCPPIGIIPWTWGEILTFFVTHFIGIKPEKNKILIKPKLLNLVNKLEAKIHVKNILLNLKISKKEEKEMPYAIIDKDEKIELKTCQFVINDFSKDHSVQLFI